MPATADAYKMPTIDGFDAAKAAESPLFKALMKGAHANGLGQAAFEGVISDYVAEMTADEDTRTAAEVAKLGSNAETRLGAISAYLSANLPAEQADVLRSMATTADAVLAFEALMNKGAQIQPRSPAPAAPTRKSHAEIIQLMNSKGYSGRPNERDQAIVDEVDAWFEAEAAAKAKAAG